MGMPDLAALLQLDGLARRLVSQASRDELAEAARLLALNLACYQHRYGPLPLKEPAFPPAELDEAQVALVTNGTEILVTVLEGLRLSHHGDARSQ